MTSAQTLTAADEEAAAQELLEAGATDGLPVVVPTPERVARMLAAGGLDPDVSLGAMPPRKAEATIELLAINAVMAGCRPDYFPVVIAATRAIMQPGFELDRLQGRSHATGPMLIVNGPIRHQLNISGGPGCIGPGWHANATIGRAVRLIMINVGGGNVGGGDGATLGSPVKFSFCFAENEEASPWSPYHTTRGFAPGENVVTVLGVENTMAAAQTWNAPKGKLAPTSEILLNTIAASIIFPGGVLYGLAGTPWGRALGTYVTLILGPPTAEIFAEDGYTRESVQESLFERVRIPIKERRQFAVMRTADREEWEDPEWDDPDAFLQPFGQPSDIQVLVAGTGTNMLVPHSPFRIGEPVSERIVIPRS